MKTTQAERDEMSLCISILDANHNFLAPYRNEDTQNQYTISDTQTHPPHTISSQRQRLQSFDLVKRYDSVRIRSFFIYM